MRIWSVHPGYLDTKGLTALWRETLLVTRGQIEYETQHLLKKLQARDVERYTRLLKETTIELHPLFCLIDGETEEWEQVGVSTWSFS